ncbi:solute carrier family 35 member F6-like [Asterias rubens]|uniref:solute carrier family 35 member F6-like n=1 Tax=Asterias rubens TaxID=7604 RepID=UPI0014559C98|nr:solute carrier family 35 member F6-like [Asterias rubens]XP_033642638.1 solute carrier family 35 member F6-like [Asterias rubens]XP_033642639.1 solute carrier family 35 member F6-like [Asterias rubens]XP_033642640.1 solute carrier family 35 member F6-like [Asterias rubens]
MGWTPYQFFLAGMMLVTGSINTLSTKWADVQTAVGDPKYGNEPHAFFHPFFQASCMFLGELSCLVAFKMLFFYHKYRKTDKDFGPQKFNPLILLPPAMCDMCATSLMYIGLAFTYASSFQMLRGAVVIFTGLLSVAFLHRKLLVHHWLGMLCVLLGLILVGLADIDELESGDHDINSIITGDLLIIMAQIITATQMVVEEALLKKHKIPALQVVGWEGFFGFFILSTLLVPFYFINAGQLSELPDHVLDNAIDAFYQIKNNTFILVGTVGTIVSIAFFNFSGVSVTKEMNATTRMVLDSLRTMVIWAVSLIVRWENFEWLQLLGFFSLILGTFIYNDAVFAPLLRKFNILPPLATEEDSLREPLLSPSENDINYSTNGLKDHETSGKYLPIN